MQDITDNVKLSKTIQPYFSDKIRDTTKLKKQFVEKDSIKTDEKKNRIIEHHKKLRFQTFDSL